jgi:predicted Zn-dependent protease
MTDDELAFIIGHEYAHIEQEHLAKQRVSAAAKHTAIVHGLSQMDDHLKAKGSGKIKRVAVQVFCGVAGGASLAVTSQLESQHYETKADDRAWEIVEAAGYNPEASVRAFEKSYGGHIPEIGILQSVVSSHPAPRSRHQHLKNKVKNRRDHR